MTEIPDPAVDFEGCIKALTDKVMREIEAVPEEERPVYFACTAAEHLTRLYMLDAPDILIRRAWRLLRKRLEALRPSRAPARIPR